MARPKLPAYGDEEVQARLERELPGWFLEDGWIRRRYKTDGWPATLMLVNAIGFLAEAGAHHPDLTVSWAKVGVKLKTHHSGGITDKDFEMARRIEDTVLWRPTEGQALEGSPNKFVMPGAVGA